MRVSLLLVLIGSAGVGVAAPDAGRQAELINLLRHDCGSCHGLTLKGGLGPSLLPDALAGKSDEYLLQTILNGRPGTAMPPWKNFIDIDEAAWLIGYLRSGGGEEESE